MKKRILALVCAMVMVLAMSLSVCAAPSSSSQAVANEVLVTGGLNGQSFGTDTLVFFASDVTVDGATVSALSADAAKTLVQASQAKYGQNIFFAGIVDISGKTGTITAKMSNIHAGQKVVICHKLADGSFEFIENTTVAENSVTFDVSSNSPFAFIVLGSTTAPKTGEVIAMICALAAVSGFGAAVCAKKAKND